MACYGQSFHDVPNFGSNPFQEVGLTQNQETAILQNLTTLSLF